MKKLIAMLLVLVMALSLVACGGNKTPNTTAGTQGSDETKGTQPAGDATYERGDDEEIYEAVLGDYAALLDEAEGLTDPNERFVIFAQAEAALLDSAVMIPNTTQGGAYTISRVAPRTVPYVQWGNDDDRLKCMVISDEFLTPAERDDLMAEWEKAKAGEGTYDPAAYLTSKGHTIQTTYTTTFQTAPVTLDWLNTSSQSDTEITVNTVDGLVEYDCLGNMNPALAESWEVSEDGLTYTFHIRQGAHWYTAEGAEYAEVTANDFVAGFRHMLDAKAGLEYLVDGVIVGAKDYYDNGGSWDNVGYKAVDDHTLQITLEQPTSYFLTMLTYSCFLPICDSFYQAHGGVYGVDEYAEASADTDAYTFGKSTDVASQVYCGPFLVQKLEKDSEINLVRNTNYYNNDKTTLDSIKWVFDNAEDLTALYNSTVDGTYAGISVSNDTTGTLAKNDGNFDKYAYVSDTTSTTYFGGLNLNRGTFALESGACASPQDDAAKISTHTALMNKNFRKALQFAFDKATVNATNRGEDNKTTNLRNMYTHPEFVTLTADVTDKDGYTWKAGTVYGDMVQYYLDKIGSGITSVKDGVDGWYNPEKAKECLAAAVEELGDTVSYPIQIDVVYYSASDLQVAQAAAYKSVIESTLGADKVQVNLVEATTPDDFYATGYRAPDGISADYDMFYGSGWGPDFGDPCSYLDTFKGEGAGYMTKVIGLF